MKKPMPNAWTQRELNLLKENYKSKGAQWVADKTGRHLRAVYSKAHSMGLKGSTPDRVWTEQELKLVRDFYPTMFTRDLAKWIGVSYTSVHRKAKELGVEKIPDFLEVRRDDINRRCGCKTGTKTTWRPGCQIGKATQFKPGHQLTPEQLEKKRASMRKYWARRKRYEAAGLDWRKY